jgi:hypothetical protein
MLEKSVHIERVEVEPSGLVTVVCRTFVRDGDEVIASSQSQRQIDPGCCGNAECAFVSAICNAVHTPECIAAHASMHGGGAAGAEQ